MLFQQLRAQNSGSSPECDGGVVPSGDEVEEDEETLRRRQAIVSHRLRR